MDASLLRGCSSSMRADFFQLVCRRSSVVQCCEKQVHLIFRAPAKRSSLELSFSKRTQQGDKSVDVFFSALQICNNVEDRLVRDQFIAGLLDSSLLEKLCRTCDLTLDKALLHARLHEDTEREKREGENQLSGPVYIDAAHTGR